MDKEVITAESFDLNESLSKSYMIWQATYFVNMPKREDESVDDYASRMCCIAFMEGAKAMQALMQRTLAEILAGTEST